MPKSKRNREVPISKTKKRHGLDDKKRLAETLRNDVDRYSHAIVLHVDNPRNNKIKDIRSAWKHDSKFYFTKNRVMQRALGMEADGECADNIHRLAKRISGQCALLLTNRPLKQALADLLAIHEFEYAKTGAIATESVELDEGPLPQFAHSMEPQLRKLGLPTSLNKGVVTLIKDHRVCRKGDAITAEQARILKLIAHPMAEFRVRVVCCWTRETGEFQAIEPEAEQDDEKMDE